MALPTLRAFRTKVMDIIYGKTKEKYMCNILVNSLCSTNATKTYINIVNTLCNNVNSDLILQIFKDGDAYE